VILHENTILARELFTEYFVCDLSACKGACCVEGEAGAPLEKEEKKILEDIYDQLKPFLRDEGRDAIQKEGHTTFDAEGDLVTPLVEGKECAYAIFDDNGIAKCGIEKAYREGAVDFKKPASCHLYPIRIQQLDELEGLNYHRWPICKPACECGSKLKIKVFQFLKEPLINRYGAEWYEGLVEIDKHLQKEDKAKP
jgi:hypothetical protein